MNPITTASQSPRRSQRLSSPSYTSRLKISASSATAASSFRATQRRRITQSPTTSIRAEVFMTADDLLREILSRLTAKELFSLTLVSRDRNNVITNPTLISLWKGHPTYMSRIHLYIRRNSHVDPHSSGQAGWLTRGGALKRTICSLDFVLDPRAMLLTPGV